MHLYMVNKITVVEWLVFLFFLSFSFSVNLDKTVFEYFPKKGKKTVYPLLFIITLVGRLIISFY